VYSFELRVYLWKVCVQFLAQNALLSKKQELLTGGEGGRLVELKVKPSVISLASFGVLCLGSGSYKLDGVYGNVYSSEALLENVFKETQQSNQSVAEYGMQLEYIIQSAVEKGDISIVAKNQMLKFFRI
jgi:hypothetical protein